MEEKNNTSVTWKTRELFRSLAVDPEKNFTIPLGNMYKFVNQIKRQTENPEWANLKTKAIVMLSVKSLEMCINSISPEYVNEEVLMSDEFIIKLIDALMADVSFIESNSCSADDIEFIMWAIAEYNQDGKNLLLDKIQEADQLRLWNILEKE